jgi:hypothetical protein
MISIFDDDGNRLPMTFNSGLVLNSPIGGDPMRIYEVNSVLVRDVFSGTTEPRPTEDGSEVYAVRKSAKLIRIDGIIRAPSFAALSDMNVDLRGAFDPAKLSQLDTTGHGFAPLTFTVLSESGDQESYALARPIATPDIMFDQYLGKNSPFRIELFCADPRRYLLTSTVHTLTGSDTEDINNDGNYPSIPTISIAMSGVGSASFRLRNNTYEPDGSVDLNLSSTINGDIITVYPNEKVVLRNGARADHLVFSTTNWKLDLMPGANAFQVSNGTNSITTVTAFHAFSM